MIAASSAHPDFQASLSFGLESETYKKYRLSYPDSLGKAVLNRLDSGSRNVSVDIGSGSGQSVQWILPLFEKVYAVEPDGRLVETIPRHANLSVLKAYAEDVIFDENSVDLVTCGTAFHWMNGSSVLSKVNRWLRPGGCIAIYQYRMPNGNHPVFDLLLQEMSQNWVAFKHPRLVDEDYAFRTLNESECFSDVRIETIPNTVYLDADTLKGFLSSTSFFKAYVEASDISETYVAGLFSNIEELLQGGKVAADFSVELITGYPVKSSHKKKTYA